MTGPVVSTKYAFGSNGQPTFLNIGRPYPDPNRLSVVVWGENRSNFPQPPDVLYADKHICVTGLIELYQGSAEMEVTGPSAIETVE